MNNSKVLCLLCLIVTLLLTPTKTDAQVSFSANSFQRTEFNNGFGQLISEDQKPAAFIGQRLRLQADYTDDRIKIFASMQDIRVWGAVPTTKLSDGFLSFHEAYTEITLTDRWKFKLGRQELNYDNARFLGNLDWAFQARAHDGALIKYAHNDLRFDAGVAYNQENMTLFAQPFLVPGHYRAAQFARYENKYKNLHFSILAWNNGVEQVYTDDLGEVTDMHIRYAQTIGVPTLKYKIKNVELAGFYYHQLGRDGQNNRVDAYDVSAHIQWKKGPGKGHHGMTSTLGFEVLSGTSNTDGSGVNRTYNPLYGTNHIHNGYMDYFFVGGRNNSGLGLMDYFAKFKYEITETFFASVNVHQFATAADFYLNDERLDNNLGTEVDFTVGKIFSPSLSIQLGYSHLFATNTMKAIQNTTNAAGIQQWAYVMLIYRPNMKNRYVGLLF